LDREQSHEWILGNWPTKSSSGRKNVEGLKR
jgi:hypothetical protein